MIYNIGISIFLPSGIAIMRDEPLAMRYALAFSQMLGDLAAASLAGHLAPVKRPVNIAPSPAGILGIISVTDLAGSLPVVCALLKRYRMDGLADVAWQGFGVEEWHHYAGKHNRPFNENIAESTDFATWLMSEKLAPPAP